MHTAGAGQGYIWLAHRDPSSASWQLAIESRTLWQGLLGQAHLSSSDVEWQSSGSLLLASHEDEAQQLLLHRELLREAGIEAQFISAPALHTAEPALREGLSGGLLVSSDSQLVCLHLIGALSP